MVGIDPCDEEFIPTYNESGVASVVFVEKLLPAMLQQLVACLFSCSRAVIAQG
jgi:hypothetical protein